MYSLTAPHLTAIPGYGADLHCLLEVKSLSSTELPSRHETSWQAAPRGAYKFFNLPKPLLLSHAGQEHK